MPLAAFIKPVVAGAFAAALALPAAAQSVDDVIATANGEDITLGDLILIREGLPEQYQNAPDHQLFEAILKQAIDSTLLAQQAAAAGREGSTRIKLRERLDRRNRLAEDAMRRAVDAAVTEEALKAAYDERYANVEPEEEVRASHILVKDKALIDEIRQKIVDGATFEDMAAEHGTDGTKTRGGDLGWFVHGAMVPVFADAAFAMQPGDLSEPVESQFGWHLIKLVDRREKPAPAFEEVRGEIEREVAENAARATLGSVREGMEITLTEELPSPDVLRQTDLLND